MSHGRVIALANHLIDRFQPGRDLTSEERLTIRFLTGGSLLAIVLGVIVAANRLGSTIGFREAPPDGLDVTPSVNGRSGRASARRARPSAVSRPAPVGC